MITIPPTDREQSRVDMVRSFGVLDQARSPQHDEIAVLACELAGARWGVVSLVDAERVWFAGAAHYRGSEVDRWSSFCTHVIAHPTEVLWIPDASADFRVHELTTVTGHPGIRFYAGAPVVVNDLAVGTVCVFDPQPRAFDPVLARSMTRLATVVAEDLAARHREQSLRAALSASADALIDCNDRGVITYWSPGAAQLFGYSAEEAVGSNIALIVPPEHKAAHIRAMEHWRLAGGGRVGRRLEVPAIRKDGSLIDMELWMSVAHERGVPQIHSNIRDISARKAQAAALQQAMAAAEAANEAKTTFLANVSHELRTPLNGVIGVAELLAQTDQTEHQRELTSIIKSSSDHLARLIGDILDLARIEAGTLALEEKVISVAEVVEEVTAVADVIARSKGVMLHRHMVDDLSEPVIGDPLRLRQVLSNLVSNAVKFTEGGSVTLAVSRSCDDFTFEVRDTGIGFSPEQREQIFARFQQADGTITRRFGGTGLGLAISAELVEAMGGRLDCESTPGCGARFWFTVPLKAGAPVASTPSEEPEATPFLKRVLVVDDNATNRRVAELILQTVGVEVAFAEDGDQAVDAFLAGRFDAVLMDMMMPVMDGAAATRAIRDIERTRGLPRTPILMLTANSLPQHVEASLAAGADVHLPKPISATALIEALANIQAEVPSLSADAA